MYKDDSCNILYMAKFRLKAPSRWRFLSKSCAEDDSKRTQLTFSSESYSWFPSWSPDGEKITFSSNRSGKYAIYMMGANGKNEKELAAGCVFYFSPDGKHILYSERLLGTLVQDDFSVACEPF